MSNRKRRTEQIALIRSVNRDKILEEMHAQAEAEFESRMKSDMIRVFSSWILVLMFIALASLLFSSIANAGDRPKPTDRETAWSRYIAEQMQGQAEVRLPDGSRCDILTITTAYEVEWSDKWEQSIGQSLNYMIESKRNQAGVILLLRGDYQSDLDQTMKVVSYLQTRGVPIHLETIEVDHGEESSGDSGPDN